MNLSKRFIASAAALFLLAGTTHAQVFTAFLSGPRERPPNASPGTGFATVTLNLATHTFRVEVNFTGLLGTTTNAHIHAYFNIHTSVAPGGEIRGFLVPEPASIALLGVGGAAVAFAAYRRRRQMAASRGGAV